MPLFTGVAVLTLAIGIGANTAIFSVIEGVLLKPLPYPRPDELVVLDDSAPGINLPRLGAAPFVYFTYREDGRAFQDVGLWTMSTASVTGLAKPEEVATLNATDAVVPMLGAQPMLGRLFSKADDTPGTPETVVLTSGYWRSRFGGDRSAIGRTLMLNSRPREIIGVLPDTFRFPRPGRLPRGAAPARSQQGRPRAVQLLRHRAAEAGRDPGTGRGRRHPDASALARPIPAVPRRQRENVRGSSHRAEPPHPEGRPGGRRAEHTGRC